MTILACAHADSSAPPAAFFDRWADVTTWPEWSHDTEWVRLDGPFAEGGTGTLKPKGGPAVRFRISRLVPGQEFTDVSTLLGARLTFAHVVRERHGGGGCDVDVTVSMSGPLRLLWTAILGTGVRSSVQPDLDRLVAVAETVGNRA